MATKRTRTRTLSQVWCVRSPSRLNHYHTNQGLASAGTVLTRSESLVDGFQPVVPAIVPHGQVQQNPRPRRGAAWNDNEPDSTLPCPEEELPTFALRPVPYGDEIKCRILRKKSIARGGRNYPSYELYIEDGDRVVFFLSARKTNYVSQSSHYVISTERLDRWTKEATVAHVRNFIGTAFSIYDNADFSSKLKFGTHEEFAAVLYEPNILGVKGPRKMTAILPAMGENGKRAPMHPQNEKETLLFRSKRDIDPDVHVMHNKTPQWNAETESFVLNFNTRVTMASVKNFQIVHDHDRKTCLHMCL
ncbi:Tub family-domain-containing protein [Chytriomyces sp. MP71]|nr:Tub family-domain-containing protein [Chytriomyces sp. MP71]